MQLSIRDLLDGLEDSSVPMEERDVVSATKIKELTRMKLEQDKTKTGRTVRKRILTLALAAALVLALGAVAWAAWSIHAARQQELRQDLHIEENGAGSYVEFPVPDEDVPGLVLLSTVNDGEEQRVYVDISPVSEEEVVGFTEDVNYTWSIEGTEIGGFAGPKLPADLSVSGDEAIREALLTYAYDRETRTMTLECYMGMTAIRRAQAELGTEALPLLVHLRRGQTLLRSFGPVSLAPTEEQIRVFDFGPALYRDEELDREVQILGLELTPFSAVWKLSYPEAEQFHRPDADWEAYAPWSALEDKICVEAELVFSDGSVFSTGGALTSPYADGAVRLNCGWGRAIDIDDVVEIRLGDRVLWSAD
ncbi:MAG: hypothetical protein IK095_05005 [Oscillospiraceae bacterium]|nr:hypothetical protein [Oscillospiraceae bacterium]